MDQFSRVCYPTCKHLALNNTHYRDKKQEATLKKGKNSQQLPADNYQRFAFTEAIYLAGIRLAKGK